MWMQINSKIIVTDGCPLPFCRSSSPLLRVKQNHPMFYITTYLLSACDYRWDYKIFWPQSHVASSVLVVVFRSPVMIREKCMRWRFLWIASFTGPTGIARKDISKLSGTILFCFVLFLKRGGLYRIPYLNKIRIQERLSGILETREMQ